MKEGTLPITFCEVSITLTPKLESNIPYAQRNKNLQNISKPNCTVYIMMR